jgi:hypothetical protein
VADVEQQQVLIGEGRGGTGHVPERQVEQKNSGAVRGKRLDGGDRVIRLAERFFAQHEFDAERAAQDAALAQRGLGAV